MTKRNNFFYFLSFLEGASVMAAELLGAKMLAPYFGSSLYVWASVLGITLGGLAMGYFAGGILSQRSSPEFFEGQRKNREQKLYFILLASAVFLAAMPVLAAEVMVHTARFPLLASIVISSLVFLFPPVFFMGMVSPMIVGQISNLSYSGKAAGIVFSVSTAGGITSTFLLGFYFIPNFGLTKPAIVSGIILGIIPFIKLIMAKRFFPLIFFPMAPIAIGGSIFFLNNAFQTSDSPSSVSLLYSSEGLLGQIIVADYPLYEEEKKVEGFQRVLFVNRSTQTILLYKNGEKRFFEYVHVITEKTKIVSLNSPEAGKHGNASPVFSPFGGGGTALVLGLGGGCVANELAKNGFQVDAVELDERMADAAKKYFYLEESVNVRIDDARHFVKSLIFNPSSLIKYEVIVLDAFIGEVNPHHLFTKEFFAEITSILSDSGVFFINGNGYWSGEAGKGMRSVCKTLINSDFDVDVVPTREEEAYRNLVFIARPGKGRVSTEKTLDLNLCDAVVLVDEKPQLEILNAQANKRWREMCMNYFLSGYYSKRDVLLFK